VFVALGTQQARHQLPPACLHALLDAFEQDVGNPVYADWDALLGYCRRSADPIGRLLMHLYGLAAPDDLRQSDAICSALQLINFWQDLSVDGPRGRCYVPQQAAQAHGLSLQDVLAGRDSPQARAMVRDLCERSAALMRQGAPLALRVPGRAGWELRLVVQGGLRVLQKIRQMDHATLTRRPSLTLRDAPVLLWRAMAMRRSAA
jgi:squalene synthase HpnC